MSAQPEHLPREIADHPLMLVASDLSVMAWEQMLAWRGRLGSSLDTSVVDTKTSPNDLVTLADAEIESLVRGYLASVRPDDLMVGEEGGTGDRSGRVLPARVPAWAQLLRRGCGAAPGPGCELG